MANNDAIDARLWRWAEWLKAGDGSGYPVRNILHPSWMPPAGRSGGAPAVPTPTDAKQTHRLLHDREIVSDTQRATVSAVYLLRMSAAEAAAVLHCAPSTVRDRIARVQAALAAALSAFDQPTHMATGQGGLNA